jgi:hypothetical protein
MNSTLNQPELPEDYTVVLPANCGTVSAEDIQVRLVIASDHAEEIRVNAAKVENLGHAVLQLLLAAKLDADTRDMAFQVVSPSQAFIDRAVNCQLAEMLGLVIEEEKCSE